MEIVITIEREPGAPTVGISSDEPAIYIVRDANATNSELLAAYASVLDEHQRDVPETATTISA